MTGKIPNEQNQGGAGPSKKPNQGNQGEDARNQQRNPQQDAPRNPPSTQQRDDGGKGQPGRTQPGMSQGSAQTKPNAGRDDEATRRDRKGNNPDRDTTNDEDESDAAS